MLLGVSGRLTCCDFVMRQEIVLITGANGMIARVLGEKLVQESYSARFLTRCKRSDHEYEWDIAGKRIDAKAFEEVSHIVHLAGAGIADKPWTDQYKHIIRSSRVDSARLILDALKKNDIRIKSFISASAVGFYGTVTSESIFSEDDKKGARDFLSEVCEDWEQAAQAFSVQGVSDRTVVLRIGVVLSAQGGALAKMIRPVKNYLGTSLGNGKQYMPWIHVDDLCGIILHILRHSSMQGVYNAVSPEHVNNGSFNRTLARVLGRPLWLPPVPRCLINMLFGQRASILLEGSRVSSEKMIRSGYLFQYETLEKALQNLLRKSQI